MDEREAFEGDMGTEDDDPVVAELRREREERDTDVAEIGGRAGYAERELGAIADDLVMGAAEAMNAIRKLETFGKKHGAARAIARFAKARLEDLPTELEAYAARLRATLNTKTKGK